MKISLKLYRTASIPTEDLLSAIPPGPKDDTPEQASARLHENYYPFTPRFKVFWGSQIARGSRTVVGIEAMGFNLAYVGTPVSGMVLSDPLEHEDVLRLDGALEGELNRLGLSTEFEGFEWRWTYEVAGN